LLTLALGGRAGLRLGVHLGLLASRSTLLRELHQRRPADLVQVPRLADVLCHREQRHVGQQLTLAYDRRQIILERGELTDQLVGQYVDVYDFADRPLEVRWKGHSLPYRVSSKDQRMSHTAVVENKRLRHALATVKAQ
jgi:hypothetical protein